MAKTPAWQRKEGKNPKGGLNAKGRASYNAANPGKPGLKAPQPEGGSRKKSFCARMTGMKKKLLILSQLKQDKRIYIFDEPFNGLDIESNKALQIIIEILNKKEKTIFIASHIIEPLYTICHKIHHLKDKTILKTYLPTDYEDLDQEVFGQLTDQLKNSLNHSI